MFRKKAWLGMVLTGVLIGCEPEADRGAQQAPAQSEPAEMSAPEPVTVAGEVQPGVESEPASATGAAQAFFNEARAGETADALAWLAPDSPLRSEAGRAQVDALVDEISSAQLDVQLLDAQEVGDAALVLIRWQEPATPQAVSERAVRISAVLMDKPVDAGWRVYWLSQDAGGPDALPEALPERFEAMRSWYASRASESGESDAAGAVAQ